MHSNNIKSMRSFVRNSNTFSGRSKRLTSQILPCYFEKKGGGKMDDVKKKMNPIEYDWTTIGDGRKHRDPVEEMMFYQAVASGSIGLVQDNCSRRVFEETECMGILSDDPVRNLKYHFVVTTAMITRFCWDGGMPLEEAFGLSDFYIQHMDRCKSIAEIVILHDQMSLDYAGRMNKRKNLAASSRQVADAINYIYSHISQRLTVKNLAKAVNSSPSYLSRVFKQEVGVSISEYIRMRKIDAAKNLLRLSDHELADIAYMLSYSSQSHFIQQFRSAVGMTPKAYRDKYYMNFWVDIFNKETRQDQQAP